MYVDLDVAGDPFFERDDQDLHCEVEIPFFVAALGGEIKVPTLHSEETLRIKAGSQPGDVARLKGQGAPTLHGSGRGDQLCHLKILIPKRLDKEQRELLESFSQAVGYDPENPRKAGFFERLFGDESD